MIRIRTKSGAFLAFSGGIPDGDLLTAGGGPMNYLRSTAALALVLAAACQDAGTAVRPEEASVQRNQPEGFATRGPAQTGWIIGQNGKPMEVIYEVQNGSAIWEGDIDLGPVEWISRTPEEAVRRKNNGGARMGVAIDGSSYRWPGGVVPYVIPSGFPTPSRITSAISHIEANTNGIDFVVRTNQAAYVEFRTSTGCSSNVGRIGGRQYVNLASGCSTGNTIHELLHALGVFHEHTRCDRDTYVTINTANIQSGYAGNFTKQCTNATDYSSYAEGSIMHYASTAFSSNGQPTIVSKRGLNSQMGQRSGMNSTDISTINTLYP
jgi:Astacin (Peptidase family M12A)